MIGSLDFCNLHFPLSTFHFPTEKIMKIEVDFYKTKDDTIIMLVENKDYEKLMTLSSASATIVSKETYLLIQAWAMVNPDIQKEFIPDERKNIPFYENNWHDKILNELRNKFPTIASNKISNAIYLWSNLMTGYVVPLE